MFCANFTDSIIIMGLEEYATGVCAKPGME
jgi:hypothetical protein